MPPIGDLERSELPGDQPLREALSVVLHGVLAHAVSDEAYDPAAVAAAQRQSLTVGRLYAERGYSVASLIRAYHQLPHQIRHLLPRAAEPRTLELLWWEKQLRDAVNAFLLIAVLAFEREQRQRRDAERQAAQDQAVRHMAATIWETLHQSLTLLRGYSELLAARPETDPETSLLVTEILEATDRLTADAHRLAAANRYVTHTHSPGLQQLDLDRAAVSAPLP